MVFQWVSGTKKEEDDGPPSSLDKIKLFDLHAYILVWQDIF